MERVRDIFTCPRPRIVICLCLPPRTTSDAKTPDEGRIVHATRGADASNDDGSDRACLRGCSVLSGGVVRRTLGGDLLSVSQVGPSERREVDVGLRAGMVLRPASAWAVAASEPR